MFGGNPGFSGALLGPAPDSRLQSMHSDRQQPGLPGTHRFSPDDIGTAAIDYGIMSILCTSDMRPADQEESAASSTVYSLAMAERLDALAYAHPGVVSKPNSAVMKTSCRFPFKIPLPNFRCVLQRKGLPPYGLV